MVDQFIHRWLRVPYGLHVHHNRRPKKPRATVLFIHGIGNSGAAWGEVIAKLPKDVRVITIDLLGFGQSPRPVWAVYNARTQANSVLATLIKLRIAGPVTIVGHSLGSLVAVEVARKYPLIVQSLVLCSPPFYRPSEGDEPPRVIEKLLRSVYQSVRNRPDEFMVLASFAKKYNLVNPAFNVTEDNIDSYMATLEAAIINQTAYQDVRQLRMPVHIITGTLDPFVVAQNLKDIDKERENITLTNIIAAHEVQGRYVPAVVKKIEELLEGKVRYN